MQSRRDFLAKTAAVAGMAALGSTGRISFGYGEFDAPLADPRTPLDPDGVIGTGGMGTGHCDAFATFGKDGRAKVEIVALSDVNDLHVANAKQVVESKLRNKVDTYRNYKDLLARKDIHGVLIASPEHWHSQMAIDAITAGKDAYVEKPMCLNLEHTFKLWETCKKNPEAILQVGTQMMQLPKYREAKKLIADGAIGKPVWSQTGYCRNSIDGEWNYYKIDERWKPGENLDWDAWCGPMGKAPWDPKVYIRWRRYRKYSTGIIGDLLVHVMTPLVYALDVGWPTRVVASGGHMIDKAMENHDQVNITVEFEKEHILVVAGSTANEQGLEIMVRGNKGTLRLGGDDVQYRPERVWAEKEALEQQDIECPHIDNDQDEHRLAWLNSIRTRETPAANVEMGTKIMVIVDLATRSMWEGKAFAFDPKTMTAKAIV